MAVIIPFGDAQAHGSIAKSVTFRRFRGKVVFQKKPHARIPGTPKQKIQRDKFKDAWKAFHALSNWALDYCKWKAIQYQTTAALFFLSQYLLTEIPSTIVHHFFWDITDLDLPETTVEEMQGLKFEFLARTDPDSDLTLAHIYDKENQFADGSQSGAYDRSVIRLVNLLETPIEIPFNYPILVWWKDFSQVYIII
ncbi:hypothetical protein ES703_55697 [subsurface metagenome]